MQPITAIVLGAYGRGKLYGDYALHHPDQLRIAAVAEINPVRRKLFCEKYNVPLEQSVSTWEELLDKPKFADAVIIALPDFLHYEPCMKAIALGYDILLEKPMAQTPEECKMLTRTANEKGCIIGLTYVLRYSPYFLQMKRLIDEKIIGDVVSIQHIEPVFYVHFALSFVRGSWKSAKKTTPFILAKSSHDLDIFNWLLGKRCTKVSAMGGLSYFRPENAPANSGERCLSCACERECIFSARKIHLEDKLFVDLFFDLPTDPTKHEEAVIDQLNKTDFGRCVYKCDNDQPDHYIMNMEYEGGTTVSFSVEAMTSYSGRRTRIMGTKGDMVGDMESLTYTDFYTGKQTVLDTKAIDAENYKNAGHGGGDEGLIRNWIEAVRRRDPLLTISLNDSIDSHLMGFAAEESREKGTTVHLAKIR